MNTATERSERSRAQRVFNGHAVTRHITCCEDDRLPQLSGGKIFHVRNGAVQ